MYQPSAAFVEQMDRRPFQVMLRGSLETVTADTLEYNGAWCPSSFSLGNANGASFSAQVTGESLPLKAGEAVTLSAGLLLEDGSREEVPLGRFILTKVERSADTDQWTVTGEDALSTRLEEEYFCDEPGGPSHHRRPGALGNLRPDRPDPGGGRAGARPVYGAGV